MLRKKLKLFNFKKLLTNFKNFVANNLIAKDSKIIIEEKIMETLKSVSGKKKIER